MSKAINKKVKEFFKPEYFPDVDPQIINNVYKIDWNITEEDVECILYDDIDLSNVKKVRYLTDRELSKVPDYYEGGYLFTYNDGSKQKFVWGYYPRNLEPLEPLEEKYDNNLLEYATDSDFDEFDEEELHYFIEDVLDDALRNIAKKVDSEIPGYTLDWNVFDQLLDDFISATYDRLIADKIK